MGLQLGLQSGVTFFKKWGYKSGFLGGGFIEGEKYHIFKIGGKIRGYRCGKKLGFLLLYLFAFSENQSFTLLLACF